MHKYFISLFSNLFSYIDAFLDVKECILELPLVCNKYSSLHWHKFFEFKTNEVRGDLTLYLSGQMQHIYPWGCSCRSGAAFDDCLAFLSMTVEHQQPLPHCKQEQVLECYCPEMIRVNKTRDQRDQGFLCPPHPCVVVFSECPGDTP